MLPRCDSIFAKLIPNTNEHTPIVWTTKLKTCGTKHVKTTFEKREKSHVMIVNRYGLKILKKKKISNSKSGFDFIVIIIFFIYLGSFFFNFNIMI